MRNYISELIAGIATFGIIGCQDVYENKDLDANELLPVVSATIYNDSVNKFVDLSYAKSLYGIYSNNVSEAEIALIAGDGTEMRYLPTAYSGQYKLDAVDFRPIVGQSYILRIIMPDGDILESQPQIIPEPLKISNVTLDQYATRQVEIKENGKTSFATETGLGFYAQVDFDGRNTIYCRYRGDYIIYTVEFPQVESVSYFELQNPDNLYDTTWFTIYPNKRNDIFTLTQSTDFPEIQIFRKGVPYSAQELNLLCDFLDKDIVKDSKTICTYVFCDVISMNSDTYDFFESAKQQLTEPFRIYDPVPSQLPSNMYNVTNANKPVLGLFEASARTTRIFKIVYDAGFDAYHVTDVTGQIIPEIGAALSRSTTVYTTITYDTVQINNLPEPDTIQVDTLAVRMARNFLNKTK